MPQIFNDLSYAPQIPTYVSPPLAYLNESVQALDSKYYQNIDAASNLEIALSNVSVHSKDEKIKQDAIANLNKSFETIKQKGDWENASLLVRTAAKDFATNSGLKAAVDSERQRAAQLAALKARVGAKENGITQADYDREVIKAEQSYAGVYQDPETGGWKGQYSIYNPPAYENRADKVDAFLKDYKPDTFLGSLIKGKDGKWYKAKEGNYTITPDGQIWLSESSEMASYDEVYQAAKTYLEQDENVSTRVAYEVDNLKDRGYAWYEQRGINKKAMQDNLITLGYSQDSLDKLNNEELTNAYKRDMIIHESIYPAVAKHSYTKEDVKTLGDTWEGIQRKTALENRKKAGGDDESLMHFQLLEQSRTNAYQLDIPENVEMYSEQSNIINTELRKHQQSIASYRRELEKDPIWKDYDAGKLTEEEFANKVQNTETYGKYLNAQYTVKALENQLQLNEDFYQTALVEVSKEMNINVAQDKLREFTKLADDPEVKSALSKGIAYGKAESAVQPLKLSKSALEKLQRYEELKKETGSVFGTDDFTKKVNSKMKEYYQNATTDYAYTVLDDDGYGKQSYFSQRATDNLKQRPEDFQLIYTDGRSKEFASEDTKDLINLPNVKVVGYTNQPVYGHGYGLVVEEFQYAKDDKNRENPTGHKTHIVVPKGDPSFYKNLAINRVRQGYVVEKGKDKKGYNVDSVNTLEQIWMQDGIDRQLTVFDAFPPNAQEGKAQTITKPIQIGLKYKANVTRNVMPNGDTNFVVSVIDEKGKAIENERGGTTTNYGDIYQVQFALESLSGSGMKVPLNLLNQVDDNTFQNIKLENTPSTPYLHRDFINELRTLDNVLPFELNITGLARSKEKNRDIEGVGNSKHLMGLGIDIEINSTIESWFKEKYKMTGEKSAKIPGTNLMALIHDAGTGTHLHIETDKVPTNIEKFINL